MEVCTLAIYFRVSEELPLVVAANRDELLVRPSSEPRVIATKPWIVAGQDLSAGGTWLGTNQHRLVVGLLNRTRSGGPDPSRRSRGLLCLEALQRDSAREILDRLRAEPAGRYNGFNLLVASETEAYVATNHRDDLRVTPLDPGVHLLTNLDVNDPTCPRIAQSHRLFQSVPVQLNDVDALVAQLRAILSDHIVPLDPRGNTADDTLCVHRGAYGTLSSSILLCPRGEQPRYWHAAGPPCRTPYSEIRLP